MAQAEQRVAIITSQLERDAERSVRLLREGFDAGVTDYFDKSNGYKAFGSFIQSFIQRNSRLAGHILFVEDSRTAAVVTRKILEKHGLKVTHTDSAEDEGVSVAMPPVLLHAERVNAARNKPVMQHLCLKLMPILNYL